MTTPLPVCVVKVGGALLSDAARLDALWNGVAELSATESVVVVHGGGPQSTEMARRLGHEPRIVQGRRVTTDLDLDIVHWTIRGSLNTRLVASAIARGVRAVGISGVDGPTVIVERRPPWKVQGEEVDFGWVGDVKQVDDALLRSLLTSGFVPVVAPVATDGRGLTFNVNADTVAQAIARRLGARRFLLVTESGGVLRDPAEPASLIPSIDPTEFDAGTEAGWIAGGMLVKLRVAFDALTAGIQEVRILEPEGLGREASGTRVVA
ncbi:MAG TPA: acetylglutamate kinase [Rhodothermales bacterium]